MTTTYERFAAEDANRRLLNQENLILEVTEELCRMMSESNVSRSELAQRLGKSKGSISRLLSGDRNLTLRTIADLADSLQGIVCFKIKLSHHEDVNKKYQIHQISNWKSKRLDYWQMPDTPPLTLPSGAVQLFAAA